MEHSDKSSTESSAEDAVVDYYDNPALAPSNGSALEHPDSSTVAPSYVPTVIPSDFPAVESLSIPNSLNVAGASDGEIADVAEVKQPTKCDDTSRRSNGKKSDVDFWSDDDSTSKEEKPVGCCKSCMVIFCGILALCCCI